MICITVQNYYIFLTYTSFLIEIFKLPAKGLSFQFLQRVVIVFVLLFLQLYYMSFLLGIIKLPVMAVFAQIVKKYRNYACRRYATRRN